MNQKQKKVRAKKNEKKTNEKITNFFSSVVDQARPFSFSDRLSRYHGALCPVFFSFCLAVSKSETEWAKCATKGARERRRRRERARTKDDAVFFSCIDAKKFFALPCRRCRSSSVDVVVVASCHRSFFFLKPSPFSPFPPPPPLRFFFKTHISTTLAVTRRSRASSAAASSSRVASKKSLAPRRQLASVAVVVRAEEGEGEKKESAGGDFYNDERPVR